MKSEDQISRRILWNFVRHPNLETQSSSSAKFCRVCPRWCCPTSRVAWCAVTPHAWSRENDHFEDWRMERSSLTQWRLALSANEYRAAFSSKVYFFYLFANCCYPFHLWQRLFKKAEITVAAVTRGPRVCFTAESQSNTGDAMLQRTLTKFRTRCTLFGAGQLHFFTRLWLTLRCKS